MTRPAVVDRWAPMSQSEAVALDIEWELIRPLDVFERDGWLCGVCGDPVDPDVPWPAPDAVELDHIIPKGLGGPHLLHNVRCTHRRCNGGRGLPESAAPRLSTVAERRDPHRHGGAEHARPCSRCTRIHHNPHPEALYCSGRCRSRAKRERAGKWSPVRIE